MLFDEEGLNRFVLPSICERMRPTPPMTYGRTPLPYVPPIGTPTITLPMKFRMLLLPKSVLVPKKLGLYPKSNSPPTTPAPMPPALTPNVPRPLSKLLPNAPPTQGVTNPSARASIGASTSATAPAHMRVLMNRVIALHSSCAPTVQATCPQRVTRERSRRAELRRGKKTRSVEQRASEQVRRRATRRTRRPRPRQSRPAAASMRRHTAATH